MVEEQNSAIDPQKSVLLKLDEPRVDADNPWGDDLLSRQDIAARLTNLIAYQEPPLTISLHGQWGTGKTFLLRRWQKALENDGFQAIYFNAWEDDFSNDPLLSIIGQLSDYFRDGTMKTLALKVAKYAVPMIVENLLGVAKATVGLTLKVDQKEDREHPLLDAYLEQKETKDHLKTHLAKLSKHVAEQTNHPLVFIVDELDRCRPTFAIELLERVKHIFDVPNLVFVFGLNRDELCKSLASVYGDIKTDVYLRRFFDFEFNLPESASQGFALHLIDRFQLGLAFQSLSDATGNPIHKYDYDNYRRILPRLWSTMGLSLRDIDYGIRLLAFMAKNVREHIFTHPYLLTLLIGIKFKKPDVYPELVKGNFRASEIMDYVDSSVRQDLLNEDVTATLDRIEGFLYCADNTNRDDQVRGENARTELQRLRQGDVDSGFQCISNRAQTAEPEQISRIIRAIEGNYQLGITNRTFADLAELIDVYQAEVRR